MITLDVIRKLARSLPGTEEGTSYGTPAFRVGRKLMLRLHNDEDAIVILLNSVAEQQALIEKDAMSYFITPHYDGYPAVLVRPTVPESEFSELLELAWRRVARKKDLALHARQSGAQ